MRIDEFEFQDKNGNEIEPTKDQLVIYIRSLHEQIKNLKIDLKDYMELEEKISTKYDKIVKQFKSQPEEIIDKISAELNNKIVITGTSFDYVKLIDINQILYKILQKYKGEISGTRY